MAESVTFKNFIGGKWVPAESGETFQNINPADREDIIGEFPASGPADVEKAVAAAKKAFDGWRKTPAPRRGEIIFRAGELMKARKEEISRAMTREMGKVLKETRGDTQEGIDTAYIHGAEGRRLHGFSAPCEMPNKAGWTVRAPIGVAGLITPWNFPMAIPTWKSFPALVSGNTVVFKPASDVPHTGDLFAEILMEAGVPEGVFNLVHGDGRNAGAAIVKHPDTRIISFTGSSEVGREINSIGGDMLKRVSLELGGKNAQAVMEDADLDLAIEGVLWGAFGTTGQRCTATSRLILHKKIKDEFISRLLEKVNALKLGNGLDETSEVGPLINPGQVDSVHGWVEIAKEEGAKVISGGEPATEGNLRKGCFYKPTLLDGVTPDMRIAREEVFGPVLSILECDGIDNAIEILNGTNYGLSSSIFTNDVRNSFRAMEDVEAGIVYINAPTIGAECHFPFGGVKQTGNGHREGAHPIYEVYTEWKTIYVDYSGKLQKAQIDNQ